MIHHRSLSRILHHILRIVLHLKYALLLYYTIYVPKKTTNTSQPFDIHGAKNYFHFFGGMFEFSACLSGRFFTYIPLLVFSFNSSVDFSCQSNIHIIVSMSWKMDKILFTVDGGPHEWRKHPQCEKSTQYIHSSFGFFYLWVLVIFGTHHSKDLQKVAQEMYAHLKFHQPQMEICPWGNVIKLTVCRPLSELK